MRKLITIALSNKTKLKDTIGAIADFDRAATLFHTQGDLESYHKAIAKQAQGYSVRERVKVN